jgi:GNAT superfamily N-acetyltransferase
MEAPQSPDELVIERLNKSHKFQDFSSGDKVMDGWLKRHAIRNVRYGYGLTYVAVQPNNPKVWGFYSLSAGAIDASEMYTQDGCPSHIAIALLGRIATDESVQKRGIGELLLVHALTKAVEASKILGIHGVLLDASTEERMRWYSKYDFASLPNNPLKMFISIATIEQGLT